MAGSDNGLTLLKYGLLIRKKEQQQAEIKKKDEKINELQETIIELQDVAKKCKYCGMVLYSFLYVKKSVSKHVFSCL